MLQRAKEGIICERNFIYADWTASGRLYRPIEENILSCVAPSFANTHTTSSSFGRKTSEFYENARHTIKRHCNASLEEDILITGGQGMTSMIRKLQRFLGLVDSPSSPLTENIVVFISGMEHHSNHISWLETRVSKVVIVEPATPENLREQILTVVGSEANVRLIGSFTACSNVTGVLTPYHKLASVMHEFGGICIIDFACSAPYVKIDMHPPTGSESLDAIVFSGHKFLGGPGTCGVLILNKRLYHVNYNDDTIQSDSTTSLCTRAASVYNTVPPPDTPGGGTVTWTNPWGGRRYIEDPEHREDGGTPSILQTIRLAECIRLKEQIGIDEMMKRDKEIVERFFLNLSPPETHGIRILQDDRRDRLPIFAITFNDGLHYNLASSLMSDCFGIQVRGGCSCAGTYGHRLLGIDTIEKSRNFTDVIDAGDMSTRPGWMRISFHPTTTDAEVDFVCDAVKSVAAFGKVWGADYLQDVKSGEFSLKRT